MTVHLMQHGGEGKMAYSGKKSDMKLVQHGGEGRTKLTTSAKDSSLLNPATNE